MDTDKHTGRIVDEHGGRVWVIHLQAKEHQKLPESTRTQWGGIKQKTPSESLKPALPSPLSEL